MEEFSNLDDGQSSLEQLYTQQLERLTKRDLTLAREQLAEVFSHIKDGSKRKYLLALCVFPGFKRAADAAEIHQATAFQWRRGLNIEDAEERRAFLEGFEIARRVGIEAAEEEAWRRSVEGVIEPVFGALPGEYSGSGIIGYKVSRSDSMLQFMLKGNDPKYNTSKTELSGPNGGPLESKVVMLPANERPPQDE